MSEEREECSACDGFEKKSHLFEITIRNLNMREPHHVVLLCERCIGEFIAILMSVKTTDDLQDKIINNLIGFFQDPE